MRIIGVKHRVKKSVEGKARPTQVAIINGVKTKTFRLENETAELDFILNRFPVKWRNVEAGEDVSGFPIHHCKTKKLSDGDEIHVSQIREGKIITKVPVEYEGLKKGDSLVMILGGSGDRLAYAASRRGEEIGADVYRVPGYILKENRTDDDKEFDHTILAKLFAESPVLFHHIGPRDRDLIRVIEVYTNRVEAMKARMGCAQRLRQRFIGRIFLNEEGGYPEGVIEDEYDAERANNTILNNLLSEEKETERELKKIVRSLDIWPLFEGIEGCGELIAAPLIAAIGDIRRFETDAKLKAFCGVHVKEDGSFPRRRRGQTCNWNPQARQALFLLADQFNRRPDSEWGQKFREVKTHLRETHPEVVIKDNGKKMYTDGHIHKMAAWHTLNKFVYWLFRKWNAIEKQQSRAA